MSLMYFAKPTDRFGIGNLRSVIVTADLHTSFIKEYHIIVICDTNNFVL